MKASRGSNPEATGLESCLSLVDASVTAARSEFQIPRDKCGWGLILEKTVGHGTKVRGCVRGSNVSLEDCSPKPCALNAPSRISRKMKTFLSYTSRFG